MCKPLNKYLMSSYHTYSFGYLNSHVDRNKNKFLCTIHLQNRHQQSREKFPFLALCILLIILKMEPFLYFTSQSLNTVTLVITRHTVWWSKTWVKLNCPILSQGSCVSSSKVLDLSEPLSSHLENEENNSTYITGWC